MPCQGKTGKNSFRFKNNVTTFTTFSFSHFVNTGVCECFYAKIHMKINEQNQMSFVKLKLCYSRQDTAGNPLSFAGYSSGIKNV